MDSSDITNLAIIFLIAIYGGLVILRKKGLKAIPGTDAEKKSMGNDFHCVTVDFEEDNACESVRAINGKRYLPDEAPSVPLEGCHNKNCQCRYVHYEDRRYQLRRDPYGAGRGGSPNYLSIDRRYTRGRRNSDHVDPDRITYTDD